MHLKKDLKIFLAGHRGMVGSAIHKSLIKNGFKNEDEKDDTEIKEKSHTVKTKDLGDPDATSNNSIYNKLNNYEITKLDINRMRKLISCILGENWNAFFIKNKINITLLVRFA